MLKVWRKMKERSCQPSVYAFNLLLRATRDCDVGPKEISCLLLQHWSSFPRRPYGFDKKESLPKAEKLLLRLESAGTVDVLPDAEQSCGQEEGDLDSSTGESMSRSLEKKIDINSAVANFDGKSQNLMSTRPIHGSGAEVLELGDIKTSSDR